jgi:hypothetical protein
VTPIVRSVTSILPHRFVLGPRVLLSQQQVPASSFKQRAALQDVEPQLDRHGFGAQSTGLAAASPELEACERGKKPDCGGIHQERNRRKNVTLTLLRENFLSIKARRQEGYSGRRRFQCSPHGSIREN